MIEGTPDNSSEENEIDFSTVRVLEVMSAVKNLNLSNIDTKSLLDKYAKIEEDELAQSVLMILASTYQTIIDSKVYGSSVDLQMILAYPLNSPDISRKIKSVIASYLESIGVIKLT